MANKVKLMLGVDAGEWVNGLRKAQSHYEAFVKSQGGLHTAIKQNTDDMKAAIEKIGSISSSASTAKGQVSEYKRTLELLHRQYNDLDEAEKNIFDSTFRASIESVTSKLHSAQAEVNDLNRAMSGMENVKTGSGIGSIVGNFDMKGMIGQVAGFTTIAGGAMMAANALKDAFVGNIETARDFEQSMANLSSLTGMTGERLEQLKKEAIELGGSTTQSASGVANAFRLIGSAMPQLLGSSSALSEVTKQVITLSEAAGIDLQQATATVATSINQMGATSSDASRYVNVLAAASQKGAGDIAWLGEAITNSATAAKAVGTGYEELVANLEQLAQSGYDAGSAGTALRSIIMNLEKQADSKLKPSVVGLTAAFENLGQKQLTIGGYQDIVGKQFAAQAMALADAAGKARDMQEAITGTKTAEEQAAINTDTLNGSLNKLSSQWEQFNLHINDSNGFLKDCVDWLTSVIGAADKAFTSLGRVASLSEQMNGGEGTGSDTRIGKELSAVRGSNYKNAKIRAISSEYDKEIKDAEKKIAEADKRLASALSAPLPNYAAVSSAQKIKEQAEARVQALKEMKTQFRQQASEIAKPKTQEEPTKSGNDGNDGNEGNKIKKKADEIIPEGSIAEVESRIKKLQDAWKNATTQTDRNAIAEKLKEANGQLDIMMGKLTQLKNGEQATFTMNVDATKLEELKKQLPENATITETVNVDAPDTIDIAITANTDAAAQKVNELTRSIEDRDVVINVKAAEMQTGYSGLSTASLEAWINESKNMLKNAEFGSDLYSSLTANLADANALKTMMEQWVKVGLDTASFPSEELWDKILGTDGDAISNADWQTIEDTINERLKELKLKPIKLDVNTGALKSLDISGATEDWKNAASAINSVGSALSGIEDPSAKVLGIIASAIATVAQTFAKSLEGTVTPWDWIAAAAAGTATMVSTISAIKSATEYHAEGGIAGMPNFTPKGTDTIPAMLTPGETILSVAQTQALSGMLGGIANRTDEQKELKVSFSGEKITIAQRNADRRRGRSEYIRK